MVSENLLPQTHIDQGEVIVKSGTESGVDLMIQVQAIDESFPNDPVEIDPEKLLKKLIV